MEDNVKVVKLQRSDSFGYGFSIFGGENCGFPPVIYEVLENSPADHCGLLEAGDVILAVDEKEVLSFTTKEVLKCLRLSNDVVTLKVKKDQSIKKRVHAHMAHSSEFGASNETNIPETCMDDKQNLHGKNVTKGQNNFGKNGETHPQSTPSEEKPKTFQPKFETFMMTGDLIINLNTESSHSADALSQNKKNYDAPFYQSERVNCKQEIIESNKHNSEYLLSEVGDKKGNYSYGGNFVRTSKSDDYLQQVAVSGVGIDVDDNIATSFSTLLDTSKDNPASDRIVWTYNAPVATVKARSQLNPPCDDNNFTMESSLISSKNIHIDSDNFSSVSSSKNSAMNNCYIQSKIINREDNHTNNMPNNMYTYSENSCQQKQLVTNIMVDENKIYVKVLPDQDTFNKNGKRNSFHLANMQNSEMQNGKQRTPKHDHKQLDEDRSNCASPGDEDSDIESLHSFHYSPKAIDMPSALRLAKRLYNLEGFKKSDVSRHLCKNNDFSRVVAEEYLGFFNFQGESLDGALRKFLKQFCLIGETQERERVLLHFSKRYLDCNSGAFESQDAVHTLTCALMLLNTDLHGENVGRHMTCSDFVENLAELNEGNNFPKDVLKSLYHSIKSSPLEWAVEEDDESSGINDQSCNPEQRHKFIGHNPFLEVPNPNSATEYKKGYVMRKCCIDPNGKKTPIGKRSWKMFYATLRDLVLYLHKDEDGFRKNQLYENLHNSIRIHHALATKATDYTKKCNVFRLQSADLSEYLFQTSDSKELQSWIDAINYVAASLSAPPLAAGIGSSQKKFQRPLLPVSHTKLNFKEQLLEIECSVARLEKDLEEHLMHRPNKNAKSRHVHDFVEIETYLQSEVRRYRTYAFLLRSKLAQYPELEPSLVAASIGEVDEAIEKSDINSPNSCAFNNILNSASMKTSLLDRYSYRAAIYKTGSSESSI